MEVIDAPPSFDREEALCARAHDVFDLLEFWPVGRRPFAKFACELISDGVGHNEIAVGESLH